MKTLLYRLLLLLVASTAFFACAGSRQFVPLATETNESSTDARIYVVRTSIFGSAVPFAIYSDSTKVGKIGANGHLCWLVKPGNHVVTIGGETKKRYPLVAKAGESYYFKAVPQMGIFIARAKLKPLTSVEAPVELAKTRRAVVE